MSPSYLLNTSEKALVRPTDREAVAYLWKNYIDVASERASPNRVSRKMAHARRAAVSRCWCVSCGSRISAEGALGALSECVKRESQNCTRNGPVSSNFANCVRRLTPSFRYTARKCVLVVSRVEPFIWEISSTL